MEPLDVLAGIAYFGDSNDSIGVIGERRAVLNDLVQGNGQMFYKWDGRIKGGYSDMIIFTFADPQDSAGAALYRISSEELQEARKEHRQVILAEKEPLHTGIEAVLELKKYI